MVLSIAAIISLSGCDTIPMFGGSGNDPALAKQTLVDRVTQLETKKHSADALIESLQSKIADYQEQLDAIPDDGQLADQIRDGVVRLSEELAKVQAVKDDTNAAIADTKTAIEAINDDPLDGATGTTVGLDGIAAGVTSVSGVLPPPWNTAALLVATGLGGVAEMLRRKQRKDAQQEIASQEAVHQMMLAGAEEELKTVIFGLDNAQKADPQLKAAIQKNGATIRATNGPALNAKIKAIRAGE